MKISVLFRQNPETKNFVCTYMLFTMKDAENLSGIKSFTIRIWEKRYSILKPQRSLANIRYYDTEEIKTILNIALLNKSGHKISTIAKMPENVIKTTISSSGDKNDIIVNDLIHKIIDADIVGFEDLLGSYTKESGIHETVVKILSPLLEKSETLWQLKNLNPALKHWVCYIIKQKIFAALDTLTISHTKTEKCACLFLPTGASNDMGILLMSYLLKKRGIRPIYLGPDVPMPEVTFISKLREPDFLYVHLSGTGIKFKFNKFIAEAGRLLNHKTLIISGGVPNSFQRMSLSKIIFRKSVNDAFHYIASSTL